MLGKTLINNEWFLCIYENERLSILKEKCSKPMHIIGEKPITSEDFLIAFFETGEVYYFYLPSGLEYRLSSDFYFLRYENLDYFVLIGKSILDDYSFMDISSISFIGGIIEPMLELTNDFSYDITLEGLNGKMNFNINCNEIAVYRNVYGGNFLLSKQDKIHKYSINFNIEPINSIELLNKIIDKIYKFIQLVNVRYSSCIEKLEITTKNFTLCYFKKNINYSSEKVHSFNYLQSIKNNINSIFEYIERNNPDLGFLSLMEQNEFNKMDYYCLGQSIEQIVAKSKLPLNEVAMKEVELYKKLKEDIAKVIKSFEKANGQIDNNKKNLIFNLVELNTFRKKVTILLDKYNDFSKIFREYASLPLDKITVISKKIHDARNQIHGNEVRLGDEIVDYVQYVLMGICLYICDECKMTDFEKFSMLNNSFSYRIQQVK